MQMTKKELENYTRYNDDFLKRIYNKDNQRVCRGRQNPAGCMLFCYFMNKGLLSKGYVGPIQIYEIFSDLQVIYGDKAPKLNSIYSSLSRLYQKEYLNRYIRLEPSTRESKLKQDLYDYIVYFEATPELYKVAKKIGLGYPESVLDKLDDNHKKFIQFEKRKGY